MLRYADSGVGIIDGALFALVYGTNPEIVAIVECRPTDAGRMAWWYAFVPLTTAPAAASLDGKEVWSKPHSPLPRRSEPYTFLGDPVAKEGSE